MPSRFERNSTDAISSTQPKGETENEAKDSHVSGNVVGRYSGVSPGDFGAEDGKEIRVMITADEARRMYRKPPYTLEEVEAEIAIRATAFNFTTFDGQRFNSTIADELKRNGFTVSGVGTNDVVVRWQETA